MARACLRLRLQYVLQGSIQGVRRVTILFMIILYISTSRISKCSQPSRRQSQQRHLSPELFCAAKTSPAAPLLLSQRICREPSTIPFPSSGIKTLGPMESSPAMSSAESLHSLGSTSCCNSSQASLPFYTSTPALKRNYTSKMEAKSPIDASVQRGRKLSRASRLTEQELAELMSKIPNIKTGTYGQNLRDRALKQLQSIDRDQLESVLNEYTRIPRTIEPFDMLKVKEEQRVAIRDSVAKAKAALERRLIAEQEEVDRMEERTRPPAKLAKLPKLRTDDMTPVLPSGILFAPHEEVSSATTISRSSTASSLDQPRDVQVDYAVQEEISLRTTRTSVVSDDEEPKLHSDPASAECFSRLLMETGASHIVAPITFAVVEALTPPDSRASTAQDTERPETTFIGHPQPSKDNPFGSFLSANSALPDGDIQAPEVRMCEEAHTRVQDGLRNRWRPIKHMVTAEEVARRVWESIPQKVWPVSHEFEGHLGQMRSLTREQLIYVWTERFWQRCKDNGW